MRFLFLASWLLAWNLPWNLQADPATAGSFDKVFIVVFENTSLEKALKSPFLTKLATEGALLKNFYAVARPSQPNYIAMVAGDTLRCASNDKINLNFPSIADLLEKKGKSWKSYVESYPGNCFRGEAHKTYARKHSPFISFKSIYTNPERCKRIVNASELKKDIEGNTLPDYSFYVPDMMNSGHDTSVDHIDKWYSTTFGPYLKDARFMKGMLLITTFDEGNLEDTTNHIYTSFYGAGVKAGATSNQKYNFYNLLKTIEGRWDLGNLGQQDAVAQPIHDIFQ